MYGTRLVVVAGQPRCGAVLASVEELMQQSSRRWQNLCAIAGRVRPAIEPLLATERRHKPEALMLQAVRQRDGPCYPGQRNFTT